MAKQISIECAQLRTPYLAALRQIFGRGVKLDEISFDALAPIKIFLAHTEHCPDCDRLREEQNKALQMLVDEY